MTGKQTSDFTYRVADLSQNRPTRFKIEPDSSALKEIAEALDLVDLRKLRFEGQIAAAGKRDFKVTGDLGATVVQSCVVSLEPVTTRVDTDVTILFTKDYEAPDVEEFEMTDEENTEPMGEEIDVMSILQEGLALALPQYPRADNAELSETAYTEPGKKAMTDEDARPFAGLAALRDKLSNNDEE